MKKTVLVTAVGSFSAAAVIGKCKEEGYRVLGCDIYPAEWIVASGETDRFLQAPWATDRTAYLAFMEKICRQEGVDFLIPLTDVEIDVLQEWRDQARVLGVTLCMSGYETIGICRDKRKLENFLNPLKVCRTIPGRTLAEVTEWEEDTGFELLDYPVVLKPCAGRSSQGLMRISDARQMRYAAKWYRGQAENYLVQPQIEGIVVTADVVRNPVTGQTICLPRREFLRTPNGAGTSVQVFRSRELEEQCRAIAGALGICGCVNFEFIEKEEGEWHFLECNPRFSGGVAFSCMAGYNMVGNHLRCFCKEELEPMGEIRTQYLVKRYQEFRMKG